MATAPFDFEVQITFQGQPATVVGFLDGLGCEEGDAADIDTITLADGSEIYADDLEDQEYEEVEKLILANLQKENNHG
jgi:hypothetical protein